jgi:hypothetical protein
MTTHSQVRQSECGYAACHEACIVTYWIHCKWPRMRMRMRMFLGLRFGRASTACSCGAMRNGELRGVSSVDWQEDRWCMDHAAWSIAHGQWPMTHGLWLMGHHETAAEPIG